MNAATRLCFISEEAIQLNYVNYIHKFVHGKKLETDQQRQFNNTLGAALTGCYAYDRII
jgi:hypothetical protein